MRKPSQSVLFGVLLAAIFVSWAVSSPALGQSSSSSAPSKQQPQAQGSQTPQGQSGQQGQPQDPNSPPQSGPIPISSPQPPPTVLTESASRQGPSARCGGIASQA